MQFLKAHYEKVILSIVLVGLAALAALMPLRVAREREQQELREAEITKRPVKEYQPIDLSTNAAVLAQLEEPRPLRLAGEHNLFNPVRWQKRADGGVIKALDAGANALQVKEIRPLKLGIYFDQVAGTPEDIRYQLSYLNELQRSGRATPRIAGVKDGNNMFTIEEVIGNPSAPTALRVTLTGDKEPVVITPEKGYERVIGYTADIVYPPDGKQWRNVKTKDEISLAGETYNVVTITENEVVISARSNKKQTALNYASQTK